MKRKLILILTAITLTASSVQADGFLKRLFSSLTPNSSAKFSEPADPVDSLDVKEAQVKMVDYADQVIELEFDNIHALRQVKGGYIAVLSYEGSFLWDGMLVTIPPEGLDFFYDLYEDEGRELKKVYVQIATSDSPSRVVGRYYRKRKEGADKYYW